MTQVIPLENLKPLPPLNQNHQSPEEKHSKKENLYMVACVVGIIGFSMLIFYASFYLVSKMLGKMEAKNHHNTPNNSIEQDMTNITTIGTQTLKEGGKFLTTLLNSRKENVNNSSLNKPV